MAPDGDLGDEGVEDEADTEESAAAVEDVALAPGFNADDRDDIDRYVNQEVRALYDVYSYRHAASILANSFPKEFGELQEALVQFRISVRDVAPSRRQRVRHAEEVLEGVATS